MTYCAQCQKPFTCGMIENQTTCWCTQFPKIIAVLQNATAGCMCQQCLLQQMQHNLESYLKDMPLKEALELAKQYKDNNSSIAGLDYNIENGLHVFTKWFHLKRGYCCGSGCKNCPFN